MIQVKMFDCEHERDLQDQINQFLSELKPTDVIDIKYHVAAFPDHDNDQVYCFSAMIIYRKLPR